MSSTLVLTLAILTFVIRTSVSEDLLDQYVNHVGMVNAITSKVHANSAKDNRQEVFNIGSNRKLQSFVFAKDNTDDNKFKRSVSDISYEQWTHSEYLDQDRAVLLRWQLRHQEILFRVEAKTLGYVGIGFSPNGGMEGADITIGWVDDYGKAVLLDCHGEKDEGSAPVKDDMDNYTLMKGVQNDTHTILEFRRALDTCDPKDYILSSDTVRVIWALHDKDPQTDYQMIYHGDRRGTQSLHLFDPPPTPEDHDTAVKSWDVTLNNFVVDTNMDTVYWCKIFKTPTLQTKHHIIGYEPVIGRNHTNFLHHMLLHECEIGPATGNARIRLQWDEYSKQEGTMCYSPEMPIEWERCTTPVVAWAVGSKGENYPKHVGLPLENSRNRFFMLEVHFDNPKNRGAVDTSGIRLKYTRNLRKHEGGIIATGISIAELHVIPPAQQEYKSVGYCSTDCTKAMFPRDGINVVSVLLHSHLAGRKLKLRHLRGQQELTPLAQDDHYDFNYQQSRTLSHEIKILPGDALVTECTYSTANRSKPTFGGYSTSEEMCLAFILHYPKTELAGCYSMPPIKYFFETLGVKEFYNNTWADLEHKILHASTVEATSSTPAKISLFDYKPGDEFSAEANAKAIEAIKNGPDYTIQGESDAAKSPFERLIIKEPPEFQNKSFMAHLQDTPFDEPLITKNIQEYFHKGLHLTFCRRRDDSLAIKENVESFPKFTEYVSNKQAQCSYRRSVSTPHVASSGTKQLLSTVVGFLMFMRYFL